MHKLAWCYYMKNDYAGMNKCVLMVSCQYIYTNVTKISNCDYSTIEKIMV